MKKNNGVSLMIMVITIMVMGIIVSTIMFTASNRNETQKLDNMYNDLNILEDKVNIYYWKYGKLPLKEEYTEISQIPSEELNPNDYGKYYVIDLNALKNLSLSTRITSETVFIINEGTHTIYFPQGVELEGVTYYRLPEEYSEVQ